MNTGNKIMMSITANLRSAALDFQDEPLDFEPEENDYTDRDSSVDGSESFNNLKDIENRYTNDKHSDDRYDERRKLDNRKFMSYSHLNHLIYPRKFAAVNGLNKEYHQFPPYRNRPQILKDGDSGNFSDLSQDGMSENSNNNSSKAIRQPNITEDKKDPDDREDNYNTSLDTNEDDNITNDSASDYSRTDEYSEEEHYEDEDEPKINAGSFFANKKIVMGGNNCIIIQAVTKPELTKVDHKTQQRALKEARNKYLRTKTRKKKRVWNIAYSEYPPSKRCWLQDIGYVPETQKSERESCGDQSRVINTDPWGFKEPLPPVKRPPTRLKKPVAQVVANENNETPFKGGTVREATFLKEKVSSVLEPESLNPPKEDDSLSIVAPSLPSAFAKGDHPENQTRFLTTEKNKIETWLQNIEVDDEEWESITVLWEHQQKSKTFEDENEEKIILSNVPLLFGGLCHHHFLFGQCNMSGQCTRNHFVNRNIIKERCKRSTPETVLKAYQFTLRMMNLYKETHLCFIEAFAHFKMLRELVQCVGDLLKFQGTISIFTSVEEVVKGLEVAGFTFLDAIKHLIMSYGIVAHPLLVDILLEMLTRRPNLSDYWEIIKMYCVSKGTISPDIARRILVRSTGGQCDPKLCLDVYNVIIKSNITDLSQIEEKILAPFRSLEPAPSQSSNNTIRSSERPSILNRPAPFGNVNIPPFRNTSNPPHLIKLPQTQIPPLLQVPSPFNMPQPPINLVPNINVFKPSPPLQQPPSIKEVALQGIKRSSSNISSPETGTRRFNSDTSIVTKKYSPTRSLDDLFTYEAMRLSALNKTNHLSTNEQNQPSNIRMKQFNISAEHPSSSHRQHELQEERYELFPQFPIVGTRTPNSIYIRKQSLHRLLPATKDKVDMNEDDVRQLNDAVVNADGKLFFSLLGHYKDKESVTSFTTMLLAQLKSSRNIYESFNTLLDALAAVYPNYHRFKIIKGILEVVVMNLLIELQKKGSWSSAAELLCRFQDWDSLTTAKMFVRGKMSDMGIYLFFAKILVYGHKFENAYKIIGCHTLHLTKSPTNWPFSNVPHDLETRDHVLDFMFDRGYKISFGLILNIYKSILQSGGIYNYDWEKKFNDMLVMLIDTTNLTMIRAVFESIETFYKIMDKNVLRAFCVILDAHLPAENKLMLYELCCERGIYTLFSGTEAVVTIRVTMLDCEIRNILCYFFQKVSRLPMAPKSDLRIDIKLSDSKAFFPNILQDSLRSIQEINETVQKLLKKIYHLEFESDVTFVDIRKQHLYRWWNSNRKW